MPEDKSEQRPLTLAEAVARSGWPSAAVEDTKRHPAVVDDVASFLSFVSYADHSNAQMCVLPDGLQKLRLADSLPSSLIHACAHCNDALDSVIQAMDGSKPKLNFDGDVFWWSSEAHRRKEVRGGTMRSRLSQCRENLATAGGIAYLAELSHDRKTPHGITGEPCRALTSVDVRDRAEGLLPMWDRGHVFVGGEGAGSCMHVDQAWWSNVAKNYLGYKLVAVWGPQVAEGALASCSGELFRKPLTSDQCNALLLATTVALLRPGDVACFTGGLPHITVVVGEQLNVTAYESFINWNPQNVEHLLRGARRPRGKTVMAHRPLHGLLDDLVDTVRECAESEAFPANAALPDNGYERLALLDSVRTALRTRERCARRFLQSADDRSATSSESDEDNSESNAPKKGLTTPDVNLPEKRTQFFSGLTSDDGDAKRPRAVALE